MDVIVKVVAMGLLVILIGMPLFAVPATLTLPGGQRPGVEPLTIEKAAAELRASGQTGLELVEAARALTGERMAYCRRNSFDGARRAFSRGYGYCQQMSFALADLLTELGFEARVVQALQVQFPHKVTSHAWVEVSVEGQTVWLDPLFWDAQKGEVAFTPLSPVTGMPGWFRLLAGWGSPSVNAYRYYRTGVDLDRH
jgi:hypothetical protein